MTADPAAPPVRAGYRRYGPVWSVRPVRWAFTGTLIGRMAQTMTPLTLLLLFRQRTGSFSAAGIAVAVFGLAFVACGPVTARLADRHGRRVLAGAGAVSAASLVLLAVTTSPAVSWIAVITAGASVPPLTAALRATVVTCLAAERDRAAAFSLDAIATELLFVAGPALVAGATALGRTADALFAAGALVLAGSAFVAFAATARVIQFGHPAAAGTVLAVWACGSIVGGLVYGSRDWPGRAAGQLRVLLLLVAAGFALVPAGPDMSWLYPLMFVAGLATAPAAAALTTSFSAAGPAAQAGRFAWLASSSSLGGSAGYAAAGLLQTHATVTVTLLIGAALTVAAAAAVPRRTRCPGAAPGPAAPAASPPDGGGTEPVLG